LELEKLVGTNLLEFPKDVETLKDFIRIVTSVSSNDEPDGMDGGLQVKDLSANYAITANQRRTIEPAYILDFFAGSGTTAQAVLEINKEDGGNSRFIAVQLPEATDNEEYPTIADIARERIRRVIQKIQAEADLASPAPDNLGFKSFVLAPSNFKQWRGDAIDTEEQLAQQLELFVQSEKDDADIQDMLYELLLKAGFPLTTPLERLSVADVSVYSVKGGELLLALEAFSFGMIEALLAMKPKEIVCLDSVFHGSDELKTNLDLQCRDAGVIFTCI
jgi:adenine-specific DNA-methyltransferase